MHDLNGKRVAILATDGFEQSELTEPLRQLSDAGAKVDVVSPKSGIITGWKRRDWGDGISVDVTLDEARVDHYDALILPGGQINPDLLRLDPQAVNFVRDFFRSGKPLGAICHAPWLLIEAAVIEGRRATSYPSIKTDMVNAGAIWEDAEVVVDEGLVTSRRPADLDAFCAKMAEEIAEGARAKRQVV